MPEAIKEVAPEKTPEKVVAKEIKPAEASSGTLPADEQPLKDGEEGAVAPEVAAVETPEEGKSIPEPSAQKAAPASDGNGLADTSDKTPEGEKKADKGDKPEKASNGSCSEVVQPSANLETPKNSDTVKTEEPEKEKCPGENVAESSSEDVAMKDSNVAEDKKDKNKPVESSDKGEENKSVDSENKEEDKPLKSSSVSKEDKESCMKEENKVSESSEKKTLDSAESMEVDNKEVSNKQTEMDTKSADEASDNSTCKLKKSEKVETPMESKVEETAIESEVKETAVESKVKDTTIKSEVKETPIESKVEETAVKSEVKETAVESKAEETTSESKAKENAVESKVAETAVESKVEETAVESKIKETAVESKDETAECKGEETAQSKEESPVFSADTNVQPTPDKADKDAEGKKETESQKNGDSTMEIDTVSESSSVVLNGKSDGNEAGRSVDIDPAQAEEIKKLISDAKQHMIGGEHFNAADLFGKACEIAGKLYGDLASENGELYYLYGCAMLECAKNENTVLGEAVKEEEGSEETVDDKDDDSGDQKDEDDKKEAEDGENKQNGDEPAVNGDEAMEVVENDAEAAETEESTNENGVDSEATAVDGEKENEEEDDSSLKTAWEMFELAKVIFDKTENSSRLADTYIKLGEVGMESGHGDSVDDMKKALELRLSFASDNHRLLAETHFNIGLAYATFQNFDSAIESFQQSKSMLEAKINKLKLSDKTKDSEDEIKELSGLLPDLDEKIQDMNDSKAAKIKGEEDLKQGGASSSETSNKPVSNISHLVKRKRKLEDVTSELLPSTKQPCTGEDKPESVKSSDEKPETVSNEDKPKEDSAPAETPKTADSVKEESAPKEEKTDEKPVPAESSIPMEECPLSEEKSTTPVEVPTPVEAAAV